MFGDNGGERVGAGVVQIDVTLKGQNKTWGLQDWGLEQGIFT